MAERTSKVSQVQFGEALRNYVEENPQLSVASHDKHLPSDEWVYKKNSEFDGQYAIWSRFYGNERIFKLEKLLPEGWVNYATKFKSPQQDVIDRIHHHFLGAGIEGMIADPTILGDTPDHDKQYWSHVHSEAIYAQILEKFKAAEMLSKASRKYEYTDAAKLTVPGVEPFDIPITARGFHYMHGGANANIRPYEYPKVPRYGAEVPTLYLLGTTITDEERNNWPYNQHENILPEITRKYTPYQFQKVPYTYGTENRETGNFTYRAVGEMTAVLFADTNHQIPEGFVLVDNLYVIPSESIQRGYHRNNAERDASIWNDNSDFYARKYPQLQLLD